MHSRTIRIVTGEHPVVRDLTSECERFLADCANVVEVDDAGASEPADRPLEGLLSVFVPHATAGLALIETGAGSDTDLLGLLDVLVPPDGRWQHRHGSAGHGRDHVLPALVSPSLVVPVLGGRMALGTWQAVCLVDPNGDNPERTVRLSLLADAG